ncbi:hypothetical protein FIBSPDRAFT_963907 [Athelia psychrophila]|uniref:Uncharacterized protein n=1 Tax=Athelia psychrophila TaxID=1759441 RepID=A0A165YFT4_9AGAM|nr:hypothetical protein FIBSPDRAFT_963907 [Fibularhizoctonia sp. CBS 109695]
MGKQPFLHDFARAQLVSYDEHSNDSVDYVYSSWDNSALRTGYPVWDAWSDSYIREWLLMHNIIAPTYDDYLKSDQQYARDG